MFNQTRQNLSTFDNEHEFERFSSDILNSLGFEDVEPMAPLGGADGGIDIKYKNGDANGVAFVTLRKDIRTKFSEDLEKWDESSDEISLFCIVDVTPKQKKEFSEAVLKKGATLGIYDLERIRSLLDSTLKDIRRRYLGIDDEISTQIKDKLLKLLQFRNSYSVESKGDTILETMFDDKLPQSVFFLLLGFELKVVKEVPRVGPTLEKYLMDFDSFYGLLKQNENETIFKIGEIETCRIRDSWVIHYKYSLMRFSGLSSKQIQDQGFFLNYGISWKSAECVYNSLVEDGSLDRLIRPLFERHAELAKMCLSLDNSQKSGGA